jgi:FKBP-type peptidyl-prolyl cis-trans isomerase FkpA
MSATQVPIRPIARATRIRAAIGLVVLLAAGVLLAWFGAGQLRGETTPSGLQFRTISGGEGPLITAQDGVVIEYEGKLPDGTVFDSTEGKGPVPMLAGQVIPGFSEALQKMQKGGRYKFRIPAKLAYGASPPPGSPIPPNADLDFTVHVTQVVQDAAQMVGQLPPGVDGAPPPQPGQ